MATMATVIYDADCGFCRVSLALLLTWDRRGALRPLPLGTPATDHLLADLSVDERAASWHVLIDQRRFSAGAALAPALSLLPGGTIPAAIFARFPQAAERGYRWVAEHRAPLGRFVPARARRRADRVIAAHGGPARSQ